MEGREEFREQRGQTALFTDVGLVGTKTGNIWELIKSFHSKNTRFLHQDPPVGVPCLEAGSVG